MYTGLRGAYIPQVGDLASGKSYVFEGDLLWNFAFFDTFGIFGSHQIGTMGWDNVALLTLYNEIGARICPVHWLALEAAYLNHRVDVTWIDGKKFYIGGVVDHGAEIGSRFGMAPLSLIRVELGLTGRYFNVYTEDHWVLNSQIQVSLMPIEGHALILQLDFCEVWRQNQRPGVDSFTHNTVGHLYWRSQIKQRFGIQVGAKLSANLLVGEVPMLELKRSMIGEPMALAKAGVYFIF